MQISKHAVEQYLFKHCGIVENVKEKTFNKMVKKMEEAISEGEEIELTMREATIRLLNNHAKPATYIYHAKTGMLFVIVENVVVTCYPFPKSRIAKRLGKPKLV